jgi:putative ABC transport system substrate-binding protein
MKTIGFLNSASDDATFAKPVEAFRKGLADNGCVVGRDVNIISRWADGDYKKKLLDYAKELVNSHVDLIATSGGAVAAQAALWALDQAKMTKSVPLLFISGFDPAKAGLLKGGNATGVHVSTTESVAERAEALRSLLPKGAKVADLLRPGTFVFQREKEQAKKAKLIVVEAKDESDLRPALAKAVKQGARGLLVCADPFFTDKAKQIIALANELNLATAFAWRQIAEDGALMSFGPNLIDAYHQIGAYAALILKGLRPDALRVQMAGPTAFELVVNRKTADALKLDIPHNLNRRIEVI